MEELDVASDLRQGSCSRVLPRGPSVLLTNVYPDIAKAAPAEPHGRSGAEYPVSVMEHGGPPPPLLSRVVRTANVR